LAVDLDPQGNLSSWFAADPEKPTLMDAIGRVVTLPQAIQSTAAGVDLIAASRTLAGAETALRGRPGGELWLRNQLRRLPAERLPDFIILDTPPGLSLLSSSALAAAGEVLAPVELSPMGMEGAAGLLETLRDVQETINPDLQLLGFLAIGLDQRQRISGEVLEALSEDLGEKLLKTRIRVNVDLTEAPNHQQSIFDYAPRSRGAEDFTALVQEVLIHG